MKNLHTQGKICRNERRNFSISFYNDEDKLDGTELEAENLNDYFVTKLWCSEDIRSVLEEEGFETSDKNVELVLATGNFSQLRDCTDDDWKVIRSAIYEVENLLEIQ